MIANRELAGACVHHRQLGGAVLDHVPHPPARSTPTDQVCPIRPDPPPKGPSKAEGDRYAAGSPSFWASSRLADSMVWRTCWERPASAHCVCREVSMKVGFQLTPTSVRS